MVLKMILVLMVVVFFSSCSTGVTNLMDLIAVQETQKATSENKSVGYINPKAPIIKEEVKETPKEKIMKKYSASQDHQRDIEMVGYIVSSEKDNDVDLYIYTFTDALKTRTIQFFYTKKLPYKTGNLIRVRVKDNFLKKHEYYGTKNPKNKKVNRYIKSAKELFIKIR